MMCDSTYSNEKQVETVETTFEYDKQNRICKRTVTTTTRSEPPVRTISSYTEGVDGGALLEGTIELSEQSGVEKVLHVIAGAASFASIISSLYVIYKRSHDK